MPSIFAYCLTYGRPSCISNIIEMWERMDYPADRCELLILEDGGQFRNLDTSRLPGNVQVVSLERRFTSLGDKANAACALSRDDQELIVVVEDDDLYMPWTLRAHADAFRRGDFSMPRHYCEDRGGELVLCRNKHHAHAGWAFARDLFRRVGGYPPITVPHDFELFRKFQNAGVEPADATANHPPYLVSRLRDSRNFHLSKLRGDRWREAGRLSDLTPVRELPPSDLPDVSSAVERLWLSGDDQCDIGRIEWERTPRPN